jgi:HK97 family phage prohead protease
MARRSIPLDTGKRTIDLPVDGAGHVRRVAPLDQRAVVRADDPEAPIGFKGHAAVFDTRTWIGSKRWGFWEEMALGCFTKTLGEADVRFLINHDPNLILARLAHAASDTLALVEDAVGLAVDADMAPTSYGRDLAISLDRGDITQMSFAFDMVAYEWSYLADGTELLRHTEVALWDVSPVTYPAYVETDAGLRMDVMAAARSAGWSAVDLDMLARRLADPTPETMAALHSLARGAEISPPAETTGNSSGDSRTDDDVDDPPAETTGTDDAIDPGDRLRDLRIQTLSRSFERGQ